MFARKKVRRFRKPVKTMPLWRTALFEIAVIIVGILLSVAITETLNDHKDHRRERAYLESLANDLDVDLSILRSDLAQRRSQLKSCTSIIEVFETPEDERKPAIKRVLIRNLPKVSTTVSFNANAATFRAMENAGHLELIQNDSILRNLILLYSRYYDLLDQNNDDVNRYRDNFLLPYLVNNFDFSAAYAGGMPLRGQGQDYVDLKNHMWYNQISIGSTVMAYEAAIAHVESTLDNIRTELD